METQEYRLTDVCDFQGGTQPPKEEWITEPRDGYVRMLQIRDFTQDKAKHVGYVKDTKKLNKCDVDDILIGRYGASVGKILTGLSGAYNVAIIKTIPNEELLSKRYLYYVLTGIDFQNFILNIGARAAQAGFNKNDLSLFKLQIPTSLDNQERIADVLQNAKNLIKKRRKSIDMLDEFVKMNFLKLFGFPNTNSKKWELRSIKSLTHKIESGWSPVCLNKERENENEWAVLKLSAVTSRVFNPYENKLLDPSTKIKKEIIPKRGDVLFSRKNTKELVGATTYIFEDHKRLLLPDTIFNIKYKSNEVDGLYLTYLFNEDGYRKKIQSLASGAAGSMPNISKEKLNNFKIPYPPLPLQVKFKELSDVIGRLKGMYIEYLIGLQNLSDVLSQKALKGELENIEKVFIEATIKIQPKISGEFISFDKINKELEEFHKNQPRTGTPNEIDNKIRQLEAELKIRGEIPFWDEYVKYRIVKGKFKEPFTFHQLWEEITKFPFDTIPNYDEVSSLLFKWLAEENAFIRQQFNESTKQIEFILNETVEA